MNPLPVAWVTSELLNPVCHAGSTCKSMSACAMHGQQVSFRAYLIFSRGKHHFGVAYFIETDFVQILSAIA